MLTRNFSLRKLHNLTYQTYQWYLKHENEFPHVDKTAIEQCFKNIDEALLSKNREKANLEFEKLDSLVADRKTRPLWKSSLELLFALAFALLVATVIRQMVFEPYEIPSGSMRPTFREKDHLIVSKTTFGINIPMMLGHFYFDENLLSRGGIVIFSGEGVDLPDTDTRYFWLFPSKKRYIKRCMAKPFDSVYFYGGLLYGVDKDGNDLKQLREAPFSTTLDHVPFNNFEGKVVKSGGGKRDSTFEILYHQFNMPLGKIVYTSKGETTGFVFNGKEWVKDQPGALNTEHQEIKTFSDYFGMSNFAMARLLNKEEIARLHPEVKGNNPALLYLELAHTPRLAPIGSNTKKGTSMTITGQLAYETSLIPLTTKEIATLMEHLYTARFIVTDGRASRIDAIGMGHDISLPNIPNGTYEFYDGKAYEIGFGGWSTELPKSHPLYQFTARTAQTFFNYGIDFATYFNPLSSIYAPFPARYAYFREGALYVMGRPLLSKEDPLLTSFVESEQKRQSASYVPFVDRGPPIKDGKIDAEFIRSFGYTLKNKEYLVLGDNYAMSSDSRTFGAVRQENLEGTPSFIIWPFQDRFGSPNVIEHASFSPPTLIVWSLFLLGTGGFLWYEKRKKALPIFKKRINA